MTTQTHGVSSLDTQFEEFLKRCSDRWKLILCHANLVSPNDKARERELQAG